MDSSVCYRVKREWGERSTMHALRSWYKGHSRSERERFERTILLLISLAIVLALVLRTESTAPSYDKGQMTLLLGCLVVFGVAIVYRGTYTNMFRSLAGSLCRQHGLNLGNLTNLLFLLLLCIALYAFLFVVDLDIISGSGIRVGAVAAVALGRIGFAIIRGK